MLKNENKFILANAFSHRRLQQPEGGLWSQNSNFRLRFWLQIRLQHPKRLDRVHDYLVNWKMKTKTTVLFV